MAKSISNQLPNKLFVINKFLNHAYRFNRAKIIRLFNKDGIIKPLIKYRELDIIEDILMKHRPLKCLEWGSGYSTIYFPSLLNKRSKWISVEHDKYWANQIHELNKNPIVMIFHIPPNNSKWTDKNQDGSYFDLKDYVEFPSKFGKFDFILIDGRARTSCLDKAHDLLDNNGLVVLHDSNRKYYHEALKYFKQGILFEDYRVDSGGVWIGSMDVDIRKLINVERYKSLWNFYNKIGRIIKL